MRPLKNCDVASREPRRRRGDGRQRDLGCHLLLPLLRRHAHRQQAHDAPHPSAGACNRLPILDGVSRRLRWSAARPARDGRLRVAEGQTLPRVRHVLHDWHVDQHEGAFDRERRDGDRCALVHTVCRLRPGLRVLRPCPAQPALAALAPSHHRRRRLLHSHRPRVPGEWLGRLLLGPHLVGGARRPADVRQVPRDRDQVALALDARPVHEHIFGDPGAHRRHPLRRALGVAPQPHRAHAHRVSRARRRAPARPPQPSHHPLPTTKPGSRRTARAPPPALAVGEPRPTTAAVARLRSG